LQAAALRGLQDVVKLLLKHGANPNIQGALFCVQRDTANNELQGGKYWTALQAAASGGNLDVVKLLIESGADPNIQGEIVSEPNNVPLTSNSEAASTGPRYKSQHPTESWMLSSFFLNMEQILMSGKVRILEGFL
jgi:ankyrin repeat protein